MARNTDSPSKDGKDAQLASDSETDVVELEIPEDPTTLSDDDLHSLHTQVVEVFDTIFGDGTDLSAEDVSTLSSLSDGIDKLRAEAERRAALAKERAEQAAALRSKVKADEPVDEEDEPVDEEDEAPAEDEEMTEETEESATKSPATLRISLSGLKQRQARTPRPTQTKQTMRDLVKAAAGNRGYVTGQGLDWTDLGKLVDNSLKGYNEAQYANAHAAGRAIKQQFNIASFTKPIPSDLVIRTGDPQQVDTILNKAIDEKRLEGNSLVAAGGWCAPSEVLYDMCELESRDGIFSLPEVGVARGGFQRTLGPNFSEIYGSNAFFHYTELQDEGGLYGVDPATGEANNTEGSKPCFHIPCPPFQDFRLDTDGVCIQAGLLMSKGYPEVIARWIRGIMIAHDHRLGLRTLNAVIAGSTAVAMPGPQVGATAPILTAIELQVENYRSVNRLARSVTLEAVFPFWVRGAIRSDLSRRLGVDLLSVTDAQIEAWFRDRGVKAQFVYWTAPNDSGTGLEWPQELKFLLYTAGTWVRGTSDVITLDTIYDSTLLGENDYTALFTEEGWMVVKMCHDSRVITVPICADGAAHGGVDIACNGTAGTTTTV